MTGLIVLVLVTLSVTLSVVAQSPDRDSDTTPDKITEVEEEELVIDASAQAPGERDSGLTPENYTSVEEEENQPENFAGWFSFTSANTFVPFDVDMTYNYYNAGCIYRTGGSVWAEHTLQLPQGAEIDYLRIYFYDNDPVNNAEVWLSAYDGAGNSELIKSAKSDGTPGQSSAGSGFFSYIVDNESAALSLSLFYGNGTTNALRICGVRIRYQYNYFGLAMPLIRK